MLPVSTDAFCTPLQAHGGSNALELEAKSQLLIVVAEATVLGSAESASVPFYTGLFQRAVSGNVVLRPGAKVWLCPRDICCSGAELQNAHLIKECNLLLCPTHPRCFQI